MRSNPQEGKVALIVAILWITEIVSKCADSANARSQRAR